MQQYFIKNQTLFIDGVGTLTPEDSHHLTRVLRGSVGQSVTVVDATGKKFLGKVFDESQTKTQIKITQALDADSELPAFITIACGLSKSDKLEYIVQKGTETGMAAFIPLALQRDVVRWKPQRMANRLQRLEKIARAAAKQSKRNKIPKIQSLHTLSEIISTVSNYDYLLIANETTGQSGQTSSYQKFLQDLASEFQNKRVLMVFGSEGGFDATEIQLLEDHGFISCSLGPRILRAETAPIYFLSAVSTMIEILNK